MWCEKLALRRAQRGSYALRFQLFRRAIFPTGLQFPSLFWRNTGLGYPDKFREAVSKDLFGVAYHNQTKLSKIVLQHPRCGPFNDKLAWRRIQKVALFIDRNACSDQLAREIWVVWLDLTLLFLTHRLYDLPTHCERNLRKNSLQVASPRKTASIFTRWNQLWRSNNSPGRQRDYAVDCTQFHQ